MYIIFFLHLQQSNCLPIGSGQLEFEEFCILASRFLIEEDAEAIQKELREAFRLYDKEGERSEEYNRSRSIKYKNLLTFNYLNNVFNFLNIVFCETVISKDDLKLNNIEDLAFRMSDSDSSN